MSYFELINDINLDQDLKKKIFIEKQNPKPYPFSQKEFLSYLISDEFLSSINYDFKNELIKRKNGKIILSRPLDELILQQVFDQIPIEKQIDEIENEKRRRHQTYIALNYYLSQSTYFDFFSYDSFKLAKRAKAIAQFYKQDTVTPELFLLSFFNCKLAVGRLLRKYGLHKTIFDKILINLKYLSSIKEVDIIDEDLLDSSKFNLLKKSGLVQNLWLNLKLNIKNFINSYIKIEENEIKFRNIEPLDQGISFSYEVHEIFEKSAENSMRRFKTAIITPEILLLTLIENENLKLSEEIKKELSSEVVWYLFRYKLLKYLYAQESSLRLQVPLNQQFFGYLLKTQISEKKFAKLSEKKRLEECILGFRNVLILEILKCNFYEQFDQETYQAISISPNRKYLMNKD